MSPSWLELAPYSLVDLLRRVLIRQTFSSEHDLGNLLVKLATTKTKNSKLCFIIKLYCSKMCEFQTKNLRRPQIYLCFRVNRFRAFFSILHFSTKELLTFSALVFNIIVVIILSIASLKYKYMLYQVFRYFLLCYKDVLSHQHKQNEKKKSNNVNNILFYQPVGGILIMEIT